MKEMHDSQNDGDMPAKVFVQSIFGGKSIRYFPVIDLGSVRSDPQEEDVSDGNDAQALDVDATFLTSRNAVQDVMQILSSNLEEEQDGGRPELLNDFIAKMQFDVTLRTVDISMQQALQLCDTDSSDMPHFKVLRHDLEDYFKHLPKFFNDISPAVVSALTLRSNGGFSVVTDSSCSRYVQVVRIFVLFAKRFIASGYDCRSDTRAAIESYNRECERFSEDDNEPAASRRDSLHRVLRSLFLHRIGPFQATSSLLVKTFVACRSVSGREKRNGDGDKTFDRMRFKEVEEMSPTLAALQYACCTVSLTEVWMKRCSTCDDDRNVRASQEEEALSTLRAQADVDANTAASYIRYALATAMNILRSHTAGTGFVACTNHDLCGFVEGIELSMATVGKMLDIWQTELSQILHHDVLLDFELPCSFLSKALSLSDNLSNRFVGYSFLFNNENKGWIQDVNRLFMNHLQTSDYARNALGASSVGDVPQGKLDEYIPFGAVMLHKSAVQKWVQQCERVQELLLCCCHVSSGSPARSTEITTWNLHNTRTAQRNLYICQGQLVLIARYSKTRHCTGGDKPIPRFPVARTSELMLTYLICARAIESTFVEQLSSEKGAGSRHWSYLFARNGTRLTSEAIRTITTKWFLACDCKITFRQYRVFTSAMVRLLPYDDVERFKHIVEEFINVGHLQAGHNVDTADRHYGRTNNDLAGLGASMFEKYRSWCQLWHSHLAIAKNQDQPCTKDCEASSDGELGVKNGAQTTGQRTSCSGGNERLSSPRSTPKRPRPEGLMDHSEHDTPTSKRSRRVFSERTGSFGGDELGPTTGLIPDVKPAIQHSIMEPFPRNSGEDLRTLLSPLRSMTKDRSAMFRSQAQADVTAFIYEARQDIAVVMPTGSGKTLCVLLPIYIEGPTKTSVVIVPLVALQKEWAARCRKVGITVCETTFAGRSTSVNHPQVYLFSSENMDSTEVQRLLQELHAYKRLKRIVIDEAHLTMTWSNFRWSLRRLRPVLQSIQCFVPRVLLSATMPPIHVSTIIEAHAIRYIMLYRVPTLRHNVRIRVVQKEWPNFLSAAKFIMNMGMEVFELLKNSLARNIEPHSPVVRAMVFSQRIVDLLILLERFNAIVASDVRLTHKVQTLMYHGKMNEAERVESHEKWISCTGLHVRVMFCTSAFGTGVDCGDVQHIVHVGGASSLAQYAQEVGRGGRNMSHEVLCTLLYNRRFYDYVRASFQPGNSGKKSSGTEHSVDSAAFNMEHTYCVDTEYNMFCNWVENELVCRPNSLFEFLDGTAPGLCVYDKTRARCDLCDGTFHEQVGIEPQRLSLEFEKCATKQGTVGAPSSNDVPRRPQNTATSDMVERDEECFSTVRLNESVNRQRSLHSAKILEQVKYITTKLSPLCLYCLGFRGLQIMNRNHKCIGNRLCGICFSPTHFRNKCSIPATMTNRCFKCGLNEVMNTNLHVGGRWGHGCTNGVYNMLPWVLFHSSRHDNLFRAVDATNNSDLEKSLEAGTVNRHSGTVNSYFRRWLDGGNGGVPNRVAIVFEFCSKIHITKEQSSCIPPARID